MALGERRIEQGAGSAVRSDRSPVEPKRAKMVNQKDRLRNTVEVSNPSVFYSPDSNMERDQFLLRKKIDLKSLDVGTDLRKLKQGRFKRIHRR